MMSPKRRVKPIVMVGVALVVCIGGAVIWRALRPSASEAFYRAPSVAGDPPGRLLTSQKIGSEVTGARLWRIIYTSTDSHGVVVPVSGLVAVPSGPAPAGGFPLVAVAHGTLGISRGCAPSMSPWDKVDGTHTLYDYLVGQYVAAGYATVMTDFEGMGVRGRNSYLVGEVEGRNVLDSVRAVRAFDEVKIGRDTLVAGQSQGGHAALFAGRLAPTYAPGFPVLGVVAQAPVTDPDALFARDVANAQRGGAPSLLVMAADAYARTYGDFDSGRVLTAAGRNATEVALRESCGVPGVSVGKKPSSEPLAKPGALDVLRPYAERNAPSADLSMPVFIAQGAKDMTVLPSMTAAYAKKLCVNNRSVNSRTYDGIRHVDVVEASTPDVLAWMRAVRAGHPAGSNCAS